MRQPPEDDETGAQPWDPVNEGDQPPLPLRSTPRLSPAMSIGVPALLVAVLLALIGFCAMVPLGLWLYSRHP